MEHLHDAGGLNAVLRELRSELRLDAPTVSGRTLRENIEIGDRRSGPDGRADPGRPHPPGRRNGPCSAATSPPGGAVIKHSAASARLLGHTGRAVVFDSLGDLSARIDDPDLDRRAGRRPRAPRGGTEGRARHAGGGLPPDPKKLAARGVKDMVRISDGAHERHRLRHHRPARQPESAIGGPARPRRDRRPHPARRRRAAPRPAGAGEGARGTARAMVPAPGPPGVGAWLPPALPRHRDSSRPRLRLRLHGPPLPFRPACSFHPRPLLPSRLPLPPLPSGRRREHDPPGRQRPRAGVPPEPAADERHGQVRETNQMAQQVPERASARRHRRRGRRRERRLPPRPARLERPCCSSSARASRAGRPGTRPASSAPCGPTRAWRSSSTIRAGCSPRSRRRPGQSTGFRAVGSLAIAHHRDRFEELKRLAAMNNGFGITRVHLVTADEIASLYPIINKEGLVGGTWVPTDGIASPVDVVAALVRGARNRGARCLEGVTVTAIHRKDGRVTGVGTDAGDVKADFVVNCAGLWGRDIGRMAGVDVPLYACEHYYAHTEKIPDLPSDLPTLRDYDISAYVREDAGSLLVGAFEPAARPHRRLRASRRLLLRRAAGPRRGAAHADPRGRDAPVPGPRQDRLAELLLRPGELHPGRPVPSRRGAGAQELLRRVRPSTRWASSPGAGSARRSRNGWTGGTPPLDLAGNDVRRMAPVQNTRRYLRERVSETLGLLYARHYPFRQYETARNVRHSPLHERLAARGACFGETAGWERPNWYAPARSGAGLRVLLRPPELVRTFRGRAPRGARGDRPLRSVELRQIPRGGARRNPDSAAGVHRQRGCRPGTDRLHPLAERARRHRGGPHRHPPRGAPVLGGDGGRERGPRPRLAPPPRSPGCRLRGGGRHRRMGDARRDGAGQPVPSRGADRRGPVGGELPVRRFARGGDRLHPRPRDARLLRRRAGGGSSTRPRPRPATSSTR